MGIWSWFTGGGKETQEQPEGKSKEKTARKGMGYSRPLETKLHRLSETIGFPNVDQGTIHDDRFFKQLGPVTELDLPLGMLEKSQRLSLLLFRKNVRAWNAIELTKDFVIGPGVRVKAADPKVLERIKLHWRVNQWQKKLPERVRALALFGEQLYPAFVQEGTGLVRLSSISPMRVRGVVTDPEDSETITHVTAHLGKVPGFGEKPITTQDAKIKRYRLIQPRLDGTLEDDPGNFDGLAFFFPINRVGGGTRGVPDLSPSLDWLEGLDIFSFALLEKAAIQQQVVWDLTIEGADDDEVQERADQLITDLLSGSAFGHNEKVKLQALVAQLSGGDSETIIRILLRHIQAGTRMAGMFFGDSDDLTRASASELSIPVGKMIEGRQSFVRMMLEEILQFDIEQGVKAGALPKGTNVSFEIKMARVWLRDLAAATSALSTLATALTIAQESEWIDKSRATEIFEVGVEHLGGVAREDVDGEGIMLPVELSNYGQAMERTFGEPGDNGKAAAARGVERGSGEI